VKAKCKNIKRERDRPSNYNPVTRWMRLHTANDQSTSMVNQQQQQQQSPTDRTALYLEL